MPVDGDDLTPEPGEPTFVRITNQMVYTELQAVRADLRALARTVDDYPETRRRVRQLELKFYGVLAGAISAFGAIAIIVARGGVGG